MTAVRSSRGDTATLLQPKSVLVRLFKVDSRAIGFAERGRDRTGSGGESVLSMAYLDGDKRRLAMTRRLASICAVVCTTRNTVGSVKVRKDGSVDYSDSVAGDGTVPARSALNAWKLLSQSIEVNEGHMTLPLDRKAIEHTIDWVGRQFGVPPTKSSFRAWPAAPEMCLPNSQEDLMRRLEDDELTLGDFVALISLV